MSLECREGRGITKRGLTVKLCSRTVTRWKQKWAAGTFRETHQTLHNQPPKPPRVKVRAIGKIRKFLEVNENKIKTYRVWLGLRTWASSIKKSRIKLKQRAGRK